LSLYVAQAVAGRAGIDKLAPHDLRRTCARLCDLAGGELGHPIFLGHVSIQMTEGHVGCKQRLRCAVNDPLEIEPDAA
jgi:integrase